jgi:oxygen-independent coproporphyrinogen III oxidase
VPWLKQHQEAMDTAALPASETKLTIFLRAVEQFRAAGYEYIGLDHFALPTDEMALAHRARKLGRNFMGYTTRRGDDMVSLGVSSIGDVAGCFVQNHPRENEYKAAVASRGHAAVRGHELSADDRLRRDVILALMCNGEVEKSALEAAHGIRFDEHFARELQSLVPLAQDGLLALERERIRVTELGQLFLRNLALPFDRYFLLRQQSGDAQPAFSKTL